jgi:glycosyltransferase involved in cell wall biosynthesis
MTGLLQLAILSPIAWRTPPRHYGPWERVVSLLTEGLVARDVDVTLFATADSETGARLHAVCPKGYEEVAELNAKVWECLHITEVFENASRFDLIHNHFDFLPLTYSRLVDVPVVTTIHGFSSPGILPVYRKYNQETSYVAISEADRCPDLDYVATVHHGIDIENFTFRSHPDEYVLFFGRIHNDKGTREAIEIARRARLRLLIAGIVQDREYFQRHVEPHIDGDRVQYVGSAGPARRDELLGGAAALLHPIRFDEPFGLSVVEAMACGTPVVAFSRGSMPELVRHGHTGFLVSDLEEAVEALRRIGEIRRDDCRKWVEERFTVERMVDDYLRVYGTVLERWPFVSQPGAPISPEEER